MTQPTSPPLSAPPPSDSPPPAGTTSVRQITAQDLAKVYGGRRAVNGVDLFIRQGEIVGLLGPNGAGKTTTFDMIVGKVRPSGGKVLLDGSDIARLPMYQRARRGIGYLAQEASVFRKLSSRENLLLVLEMTGYPASKRRARADELLEELRISRIANNKGYSLSGGERRRVEIARALAADPSFLLLDEPFAGIDPKAIEDIQDLVRGLRARNLGVLITDHNAAATLRLIDRGYILVDGKVIMSGTAQEIAMDPVARTYYLGDNFTL
ncbi:MAG: LPS export ABC transporter ATP-binding protein [Cytophagales bacterium]|nr:LPS export ABC transporter ATP-binding protein [Armatimonadota bacterium]